MGVPSPGRPCRISAVALSMLLGVLLVLGPLAPPASAATPAAALDGTFANLLNTLRTTRGLGSLSLDSELSSIARSWSVQMASSNTLSHNGALTRQASGWAKLGENVGTGGVASSIFNALVASPPHMRNMADGEFTRVGIGTVTDAKGQIWTTHVFMRPSAAGPSGSTAAAAPAAAAPTPAPAPAPATTRRAPATTAAPVTAAPTTAAPVTATQAPAPALTTVAPAGVQVAGSSSPAEATPPAASPALERASGDRPSKLSVWVVAGAALLALITIAGAGFLVHRSSERRSSPGRRSDEGLTRVLDLL